jgi:transcription antitermination factor NusG
MYAYCLFCQTQRCHAIASLLKKRGVNQAFSPQILKRQRKKGENQDISFDLLPGYVFVFSEQELVDASYFRGIDGIIRRLGRVEDRFQLQDGDLAFAMSLYEKDGIVGAMKAVRVGDQVQLEDPLFQGCQGKITRIDARKQRARVDFIFNAMPCFTWIACDLVNPIKPDNQAASPK